MSKTCNFKFKLLLGSTGCHYFLKLVSKEPSARDSYYLHQACKGLNMYIYIHLSLRFAIETKSALKLRHIERNVSSRASTVQLAKTDVITHLLSYGIDFSGRNFHVTQRKSLEIQMCSITIRRTLSSWNIVKSSCSVFYLMELKPERERYYLILESAFS